MLKQPLYRVKYLCTYATGTDLGGRIGEIEHRFKKKKTIRLNKCKSLTVRYESFDPIRLHIAGLC